MTPTPTGPAGAPSDPASRSAGRAVSLVVWRFVDGKPGHEKQSAGLVQGIETLRRVEVYEFDMRFKGLLYRQLRACLRRTATDLPRPHLLIGVGHRTHLPLLAARLVCGGKSVVLMKPSLPFRLFDLLFIPQHDPHRRASNVIETRGVICPTTDAPKNPGEGMILLGGTNPHFTWSNDHVATQAAAIAKAAPDVHWQVCDSRRTPPGMVDVLPVAPNLTYRHWRSTPSDFLEKTLAKARYAWVTADSASMLYESLSARAHVGIIHLEPKHPRRVSKHIRGIGLLHAQGHIQLAEDGYRLKTDSPRFCPENRRCAEIVVKSVTDGLAMSGAGSDSTRTG